MGEGGIKESAGVIKGKKWERGAQSKRSKGKKSSASTKKRGGL